MEISSAARQSKWVLACVAASLAALTASPGTAQDPQLVPPRPDLRAAVTALSTDAAGLAEQQRALRGEVAGLQALIGDQRIALMAELTAWKARLEDDAATLGARTPEAADRLFAAGEVSAAFLLQDAAETVRLERIPETIRYSDAVVQNRSGPVVDRYEEKIAADLDSVAQLLGRALEELDRPAADRLLAAASRLVDEQASVRSSTLRLNVEEGDRRSARLDDILARKLLMERSVEGLSTALDGYADALRGAGQEEEASRVEAVVRAIGEGRIAETIRYSAAVVQNRPGAIVDRYEGEIEMELLSLQLRIREAVVSGMETSSDVGLHG